MAKKQTKEITKQTKVAGITAAMLSQSVPSLKKDMLITPAKSAPTWLLRGLLARLDWLVMLIVLVPLLGYQMAGSVGAVTSIAVLLAIGMYAIKSEIPAAKKRFTGAYSEYKRTKLED